MKVTIQRDVLARELSLLAGVIDKKVTIEVLAGVKLDASKSSLCLTATNIDNTLSVRCDAEVGKAGQALVPADTLLALSQRLHDGPCSLALDGGVVRVSLNGSRSSVPAMPLHEFIETPDEVGDVIELSVTGMADLIRRTRYAMGYSTFFPAGAHFKVADGSAVLAATDSYQIVSATMPAPPGSVAFSLSDRGWDALGKALKEEDSDGVVGLTAAENRVTWRLPTRTLTCRRMDRAFPDYQRIIPKDESVSMVLSASALKDILRRHLVFITADTKRTYFTFDAGTLSIRSQTAKGVAEDALAVEGEGAANFMLMSQYALNALDAVADERVRLSISKDGRAALWRMADEPDRMTAFVATMYEKGHKP